MQRMINGIVLAKVGGVYLLIATRPAWEKCPYIKSLSPINAMFWQGLESGMNEKDIIQEIHQRIGIKEAVLENLLASFMAEIITEGYIINEEKA